MSENVFTPADSTIKADSELENIFQLELDGSYNQAVDKYSAKYKSENNKDKKSYILSRIAECWRKSNKEGFINFLNTEIRPVTKTEDALFAQTIELENLFLMRESKTEQTINNLLILKNDYAGFETIYKNALYGLGYIYSAELDDKHKAKDYFDLLKSKFPNDELTLQARLMSGEIDRYPENNLKKEIQQESKLPAKFSMYQNYPNPFNPITTIQYNLTKDTDIVLTIYNVRGQKILELENGFKKAGSHEVIFDGSGLASGLYFYKLEAGEFNAVKRMLLIK